MFQIFTLTLLIMYADLLRITYWRFNQRFPKEPSLPFGEDIVRI